MIKIKNLSKKYGNFYALKDINLDLPSKGLIGISGKSGCGKTTLLNAIALIDNNYDGKIIINNRNIFEYSKKEKDKYHKSIGYIFQNPYLFEFCSVKDNIKLLSMIKGESNEINTILKRLGLEKIKDKKVSKLSGGQRQRVSIAASLISKPKILLCDEPTGSLDYENGENIMKILKEISKDILVILVSHDSMLINKYSDSIIYLKNGELVSYDNKLENNNIINIKNKSSYFSKFKFIFYFAFKNIFQHKKRTILTSIMISIGLIGIILSILLKDGFSSFFSVSLGNYESNKYMYCYSVIENDSLEISIDTFEEDFKAYNKGYFYQYDFKDRRNNITLDGKDLYLDFNNLGYLIKDNDVYSNSEIGLCCSKEYLEYLYYLFNVDNVESINRKLKEKDNIINFEYLDNQMNISFNLKLKNVKESNSEYTYFIHSSTLFLKEYFKKYISYNFDSNKIIIIPYIESEENDKNALLLTEEKKKYDYLFDNKIYDFRYDYVFRSNYYRINIDLIKKISNEINSKYIYSMENGINTMGYFNEKIKFSSQYKEINGKEINFIPDDNEYDSEYDITISQGLYKILNSNIISIKIDNKLINFKVVNIIDSEKMTIYQNSYWSYSLFKNLFGYNDYECIALSIAFSNNDDKVLENLNKEYSNLEFVCPLKEMKNEIDNMVEKIKFILIILSSFCIIISLFLMAIIVFINTIEQSKIILYLRINSMSKIDIVLIYLIESILIGVVSYLISLYFSFVLSFELNAVFNILLENNNIITLLTLKKDTLVNVFYFVICISLLSGVVPSLLCANKKYVELLKG